MAIKSNSRPEILSRAQNEVRAALKDCELLLERTRKMLERSGQDNRP
jgi:hypothetical protein